MFKYEFFYLSFMLTSKSLALALIIFNSLCAIGVVFTYATRPDSQGGFYSMWIFLIVFLILATIAYREYLKYSNPSPYNKNI